MIGQGLGPIPQRVHELMVHSLSKFMLLLLCFINFKWSDQVTVITIQLSGHVQNCGLIGFEN